MSKPSPTPGLSRRQQPIPPDLTYHQQVQTGSVGLEGERLRQARRTEALKVKEAKETGETGVATVKRMGDRTSPDEHLSS